ncbi:flagellar basal-body rod protein FlgF [Syntrophomonas palmitatica]|uniref:flagellar basal-body rod protein FlgF n=1 Tax=Syntrophomonas palmitatica TaxID=402877 RepID=UPI0006D11047|nr:flagellar basal-body rod protein FlgF [Syntrophomonas palmitatica]
MIRGLYTAAAGMMLQMARQDTVANNLANVNTSGFKKQTAVAREFPEMLMSRLGETRTNIKGEIEPVPIEVIGPVGTGAAIDAVYTDYTMGRLKKTDNHLDVALGTDGYFVVQTPAGQRYTRNGEFKLDSQNYLLTNQGYRVLDNNYQPIQVEGEFTIDALGAVIVDGQEATRLGIVRFANPNLLKREGENLYSAAEQAQAIENPQVMEGYVEDSNVNAVQEMVTLINVVRAYESLQKMVQAEDELTQVAIDQVAAVQ